MTATPGASDGAALARTQAGNHKPATDVEQLRAEIAQTRAELGETVQALAARADVKARLQESADEAKARVRVGLHTAAVEAKTAAAQAPQRARRVAARARDAVRRDPRPAALAAGLVVLLVLFARWKKSR